LRFKEFTALGIGHWALGIGHSALMSSVAQHQSDAIVYR
jgi:hypothetical protein